ncbi:putative inorganic phosphate cotransporter [Maniola jurtina]|uniref:putative inorganic phosphate cotransporter n=1 Tax=Maniola jurtina TaxID=191418 RepID=UPI001E686A50|nr:putative inorganic phosphate cotransporter [Maniola jurtina]
MEAMKVVKHENFIPINIPTEPIKKERTLVRVLRASCLIPQRYVFAIIGLLGISNAFTMRVSLNIAITQMVNRTKNFTDHIDPDACPSDEMLGIVSNNTKPYAIYDWDEETQGFLLSGFYYGYVTTQVLGGFLAERYGGKWVLGVALLSTALFTFLTPFTIRTGGVTWLFILRVLEGMSEGPAMPSLMNMMARWCPTQERALISAILFGGGQMGNVLGPLLSGLILDGGRDWAYVFYFFGGCGVLWFIFWSVLCFSEPNSHPYISKKELDYLNKSVDKAKSNIKKDPVPWKAILRSPPAWALLAANVGHDWGLYTMISDLPKYSHDVLRFNITTTGILTGLPYIAITTCSFIFGMMSDWCIKNGWHSIKTGRMIYTTIATTGPGVCIILASYAGCNRNAAIVYFILSMGLMGGFYCGMKINTLDLAPNYAGSLTSFVNTTSTIAGIITPYLIGLLTPDSTLVQWRTAFWVCFAVLVFTNIIYCAWTEGEQQWWDDVRRLGYPSGWKHGPIIKEDLTPTTDESEYMELTKKLSSEIN